MIRKQRPRKFKSLAPDNIAGKWLLCWSFSTRLFHLRIHDSSIVLIIELSQTYIKLESCYETLCIHCSSSTNNHKSIANLVVRGHDFNHLLYEETSETEIWLLTSRVYTKSLQVFWFFWRSTLIKLPSFPFSTPHQLIIQVSCEAPGDGLPCLFSVPNPMPRIREAWCKGKLSEHSFGWVYMLRLARKNFPLSLITQGSESRGTSSGKETLEVPKD